VTDYPDGAWGIDFENEAETELEIERWFPTKTAYWALYSYEELRADPMLIPEYSRSL